MCMRAVARNVGGTEEEKKQTLGKHQVLAYAAASKDDRTKIVCAPATMSELHMQHMSEATPTDLHGVRAVCACGVCVLAVQKAREGADVEGCISLDRW